jgi:hypothetical protein
VFVVADNSESLAETEEQVKKKEQEKTKEQYKVICSLIREIAVRLRHLTVEGKLSFDSALKLRYERELFFRIKAIYESNTTLVKRFPELEEYFKMLIIILNQLFRQSKREGKGYRIDNMPEAFYYCNPPEPLPKKKKNVTEKEDIK